MNRLLESALEREGRSKEGVKEELQKILDLLIEFKEKNPQTYNALCADLSSHVYEDLSDAIFALTFNINKSLKQ